MNRYGLNVASGISYVNLITDYVLFLRSWQRHAPLLAELLSFRLYFGPDEIIRQEIMPDRSYEFRSLFDSCLIFIMKIIITRVMIQDGINWLYGL